MTITGTPNPVNPDVSRESRNTQRETGKGQNPFSRQDRGASKFGAGTDMKRQGESAVQQAREGEFEARLQKAVSGQTGDGGGGEQGGDDGEPRLLAMIELPTVSQLLTGGHTPKADPATLSARATEIANTVAMRTEAALRSEMQLPPGTPITLRLQLDMCAHGLSGVTINSTSSSLDVILERSSNAASEDLKQAAQALAQSLQRKYPRCLIRIMDTPGEEEIEAASIEYGVTPQAHFRNATGKE